MIKNIKKLFGFEYDPETHVMIGKRIKGHYTVTAIKSGKEWKKIAHGTMDFLDDNKHYLFTMRVKGLIYALRVKRAFKKCEQFTYSLIRVEKENKE